MVRERTERECDCAAGEVVRSTDGETGGPANGSDIRIECIGPDRLAEYCAVPIRVDVQSILRVTAVDGGFGGLALQEVPVTKPYVKDYDSDGETPADWPRKWDMSQWQILLATVGDGSMAGRRPVGGACIVMKTPGVRMLEGRDDLAVLWDIRVAPEFRRQGIGRALFAEVVKRCRKMGMKMLKVETQNVNLPACRFYASQGAELGAINRFAYAGAPGDHDDVRDEVMLLWYLKL